MNLSDLGARLRAMADEEHEEGVERERSPHDKEWPGYDTLNKEERIKFWSVLPPPGTPARDVI
jgi:hypothetical protein